MPIPDQVRRLAVSRPSISETPGFVFPRIPDDVIQRFPSMKQYQSDVDSFFSKYQQWMANQLFAVRKEDAKS